MPGIRVEGFLYFEIVVERGAAPNVGDRINPQTSESELFFWFTRHRADKKRTLNLDLAALAALFVSLGKRKETAARELRFVLGLLLMRKRRLKLEKVVRSSDGEAMLVRKPRHKDTVRVHVFDFTPERLAELKGELRDVFEGADPDAAPDATPDATPGDAPDAPIASEDGSAQAGEDASSSEPERGVDEAEKGPSADRSRGAEPGTELCESSASS